MIEGSLDLADGRKIGYAQWGPTDAPPIFYCHGFPGSYLEVQLIRPVLERHGLRARVVALDRPGYGSSTFASRRTFLDWPRDVAEAADQLGIEQFAVLGVSGGGPYALACGLALGDRVTRAGVVVGLAPTEAPGMETAAISGTSTNQLVRRFQFAMASMAFNWSQEERFVKQATATMGEADRVALEQPETRSVFIETMRAAFAQGGRASAYEAGMYLRPWGFEPEKMTVETHLWYGGVDEMVPASAGQWLADRIPGSDFVLWPQHGHFTWENSPEAADMFSTILGAT